VAQLTQLIRKDRPFSWGVDVENSLKSLKASFTIAPLLIHVNLSKPFVLEMDDFDLIVGAILSQFGKNNFFHHVNFCSFKFSPMEINLKLYDKTFLAIMDIFQEWDHLFTQVQHEITMYLNHKNLYFMTTHVLN